MSQDTLSILARFLSCVTIHFVKFYIRFVSCVSVDTLLNFAGFVSCVTIYFVKFCQICFIYVTRLSNSFRFVSCLSLDTLSNLARFVSSLDTLSNSARIVSCVSLDTLSNLARPVSCVTILFVKFCQICSFMSRDCQSQSDLFHVCH